MNHIVVREYARLTTALVPPGNLLEAQVSDTAFDWLCQESARLRNAGAALVQVEGRRWLRLDNFVGVLETPCGTRIEILPKSVDGAEDAPAARGLLRRMLTLCLDLPVRESAPTSLEAFDGPLNEWIIRCFLDALVHIVKRGIRFDYHGVKECQPFLRGRLDMVKQLRQPPGRAHLFHIEHHIFDADRPENRLLRSALDIVRQRTRDPSNWRAAHEMAALMESVPPSRHISSDFRRWGNERLLAHYRHARPWCALILEERSPLSTFGTWNGNSLLFPMEKVFERYVEACLRRQLPAHARLRRQISTKYLVEHRGARWFNLQPDFLVESDEGLLLLDTKWKRINQSLDSATDKYGLVQADLYQLFAYGQRYLAGQGTLALVYPRTKDFRQPIPVFTFAPDLVLHVVPFDIPSGKLMGELLPGMLETAA